MTGNRCAELWKNLASRVLTSGSTSATLGAIGSKSYPMTTSSSPRHLTCSRVWGPAIFKKLLTPSKSSRKRAWPRNHKAEILNDRIKTILFHLHSNRSPGKEREWVRTCQDFTTKAGHTILRFS